VGGASLIIFDEIARGCLKWLPEYGIGYYPAGEIVYNEDSFYKHQIIDQSDFAHSLIIARVDLVNKYTKLDVLDIGIRSGNFVAARENTFGYDQNEFATNWLIDRKLYRHPFRGANSLTFWNSLELIHDPRLHLSGAREYVFVSAEMYEDGNHASFSMIGRGRDRGQCWYWTVEGLILFMSAFGFEAVEKLRLKTDFGLDGSTTFVFKRV
jgi:hypothetical protein